MLRFVLDLGRRTKRVLLLLAALGATGCKKPCGTGLTADSSPPSPEVWGQRPLPKDMRVCKTTSTPAKQVVYYPRAPSVPSTMGSLTTELESIGWERIPWGDEKQQQEIAKSFRGEPGTTMAFRRGDTRLGVNTWKSGDGFAAEPFIATCTGREQSPVCTAGAKEAAELAGPPMQLKLGTGYTDEPPRVDRPWGWCKARDTNGRVTIVCGKSSRTRDLAIQGSVKGGTARIGKGNELALDVLPGLLDALGDVAVPPLYGTYEKAPADLTADYQTKGLTMRFDPKVTFEIEHDRVKTSGTIEPKELPLVDVIRPRLDDLRSAAARGLLFSGESADDAPRAKDHSVLVLRSSYGAFVLGNAKQLRDADWVAVEDAELVDSGKTCGGYYGADRTKSLDLPLWITKSKVTLRERRSGRELAEKSFESPKRCPTGFDMVTERRVRSYVERDALFRWLKTEMKAKR